jgi:hypothetical protein
MDYLKVSEHFKNETRALDLLGSSSFPAACSGTTVRNYEVRFITITLMSWESVFVPTVRKKMKGLHKGMLAFQIK